MITITLWLLTRKVPTSRLPNGLHFGIRQLKYMSKNCMTEDFLQLPKSSKIKENRLGV